ncbi:Signal transduction histidine kinase [Raineyella antarctica]|uniref:histidine kinase n=1 Tax=Raineyella antarctica TaxID=1577474 RepID=A0A1G6GFZ5_9ACTN|nr:histidine kinase [Raineyella antarctica]SDB80675.1 Signal transduction histidine kinase [Raineyella antarctica]
MRARVTAALDCTPLPLWPSVSLALLSVVAFFSDALTYFSAPFTDQGVLELLGLVLAYGALAVLGFRPPLGIMLTWLSLAYSLSAESYGLHLLVACAASIVAASLCTRTMLVTHVGVSLVWAIAASLRVRKPSEHLLVLWTIMLLVLVSVAVGLGLRLLIARQVRQAAKVKELERLNAKIRREERAALARELHDVVAHELTVITMQVMGRRASRDPDELHEVLAVVDDSAHAALNELRKMLVLLRDEGLVGTGVDPTSKEPTLAAILESLANELVYLGYPAKWSCHDDGTQKLTPTLLSTCSRILQESVTNIIKHAPRGSACRLRGEVKDGWIRLRAQNQIAPGARRNDAGSGSLGLIGLTERVDLLHGNIRAGSRGDRWVVEVEIPLNP